MHGFHYGKTHHRNISVYKIVWAHDSMDNYLLFLWLRLESQALHHFDSSLTGTWLSYLREVPALRNFSYLGHKAHSFHSTASTIHINKGPKYDDLEDVFDHKCGLHHLASRICKSSFWRSPLPPPPSSTLSLTFPLSLPPNLTHIFSLFSQEKLLCILPNSLYLPTSPQGPNSPQVPFLLAPLASSTRITALTEPNCSCFLTCLLPPDWGAFRKAGVECFNPCILLGTEQTLSEQ